MLKQFRAENNRRPSANFNYLAWSNVHFIGHPVRARTSWLAPIITMKQNSTCSSLTKKPTAKKRYTGFKTIVKRPTDLDRDCQTISWLDCETKTLPKGKVGQKTVTRLKCKVCAKFRLKQPTGGTTAINGLRGLSLLGQATSAQSCKPDSRKEKFWSNSYTAFVLHSQHWYGCLSCC